MFRVQILLFILILAGCKKKKGTYEAVNYGDRVCKGVMLEGRQDSIWTCWYTNGVRASVGEYKEGKKVGLHLSWHPNGNLASEAFYTEDILNGTFNCYYSNGMHLMEANMENNQLMGEGFFWYPNGQLFIKEIGRDNKIYFQEIMDSSGVKLVINGNGKFNVKKPESSIFAVGEVKNGELQTPVLYYDNGVVIDSSFSSIGF